MKAVVRFRSGLELNFADGDVGFGQFRVAEVSPRENTSQHVADFLRHAQLPLRWRGGPGWLFRVSFARLSPRFWRPLAQPGTISTSKHSTTSPSWRSWKFAKRQAASSVGASDLAHVVLEELQLRQLAVVDHEVFAQHPEPPRRV